MAMIESCYEWRDYVDYIVASEETIPGDGYPYEEMIDSLCSGTYFTNPSGYAIDMVNKYHSSYYSGDDTTLSSVNIQSTPFNNLMTAFDEFTTALSGQIGPAKSSITSARASHSRVLLRIFHRSLGLCQGDKKSNSSNVE